MIENWQNLFSISHIVNLIVRSRVIRYNEHVSIYCCLQINQLWNPIRYNNMPKSEAYVCKQSVINIVIKHKNRFLELLITMGNKRKVSWLLWRFFNIWRRSEAHSMYLWYGCVIREKCSIMILWRNFYNFTDDDWLTDQFYQH